MGKRKINWQGKTVADGVAGVKQKAKIIWGLIEQGWKDPVVRLRAEKIIQNVKSRDKEGEAQAVFSWVKDHWHYVSERVEQFKSPRLMIREIRRTGKAIGDCDDATILIAALAGSLGLRTRLEIIGKNKKYYHIFPKIKINGRWLSADIIGPNAQFGEAPTGYDRRIIAEGVFMEDYREQIASRVLREEGGLEGLGASNRRKRLNLMAATAAGVLAIEHLAVPGIASLINQIKAAKAAKQAAKAAALVAQLKAEAPEIYVKKPGLPPPIAIQRAHGLTKAPSAINLKTIGLALLGAKFAGLI